MPGGIALGSHGRPLSPRSPAARSPLARFSFAAGVALLAAACATTPLPAPSEGGFAVVGRVAVRYGEEAASGRVTWRHDHDSDDLLIASPIGQGIAEITRRDGLFTLVAANGERHTADDPEQLTARALGWSLPLAGLPDWLQGRARAGVPAETRYDAGALVELRQQGWRIEFLAYGESDRLPRRLRLSRDELDIRLVIEDWRVAPR